MSAKETSTVERLTAADPALAVTEDELALSREKSLAVLRADAEQLAVGGSIEDFHRQPARRPLPLLARYGLVAAAAAVFVGVVVTSSTPTAVVLEPAAPAVTQPATAPEASDSGLPRLPDIIDAKAATGNNQIVIGASGYKAAVSTDQGVNVSMDALNTGKLGLNSAGCLANVAVDGHSGGLIFPFGTRVTESGVVLPDGTAVNSGEDFAFGGGFSGELEPSECLSADGAFLVQSWDRIR